MRRHHMPRCRQALVEGGLGVEFWGKQKRWLRLKKNLGPLLRGFRTLSLGTTGLSVTRPRLTPWSFEKCSWTKGPDRTELSHMQGLFLLKVVKGSCAVFGPIILWNGRACFDYCGLSCFPIFSFNLEFAKND